MIKEFLQRLVFHSGILKRLYFLVNCTKCYLKLEATVSSLLLTLELNVL